MKYIRDFFYFGYYQALSCIFPVVIFTTLAVLKVFSIPGMHRYDVILLICLTTQYLMRKYKLETTDELKIISVFHVIGLLLEIFKVHIGSWSYPEEAWTKVYGVPLYSGFMYASVASYICQTWNRFHLKMNNWPKYIYTLPLGVMIYLNFFTHHFILDLRWILTILLCIIFTQTYVQFTVRNNIYRMPLLFVFFCIGIFIWIAENMATFLGAWQYPNQHDSWRPVASSKISSWVLLVVISIMIIAQFKEICCKNSTQSKKGRVLK